MVELSAPPALCRVPTYNLALATVGTVELEAKISIIGMVRGHCSTGRQSARSSVGISARPDRNGRMCVQC